jgi:hypothetical protein
MNTVIQATINVGDAGDPFDISIVVDYEKYNDSILVIDWMEDDSPYDNPPNLWYTQVMEAVEDYFYSLSPNLKVVFKY